MMGKPPGPVVADATTCSASLMRHGTEVANMESPCDRTSLQTEEIIITPHKFSFASQKTTCESDYGECAFDEYPSAENAATSTDQQQDVENERGSSYRFMNSSISMSVPSNQHHGCEVEGDEGGEVEEDWVDEVDEEDFDTVTSSIEAALIEAENRALGTVAPKPNSSRRLNNARSNSRTSGIAPRGSGFEGAERYIRPEHRRTASETCFTAGYSLTSSGTETVKRILQALPEEEETIG